MRIIGLIGLVGLIGLTANAQLTANVTPGYQYSAGERPTTDTLNQLGLPTITISGTVAGTVGLNNNSVSGFNLMDGDVDGFTTLWYTNGGNRAVRVGVTNIAGSNLMASNNVLYVNCTNVVGKSLLASNNLVEVNATNVAGFGLLASNNLLHVSVPALVSGGALGAAVDGTSIQTNASGKLTVPMAGWQKYAFTNSGTLASGGGFAQQDSGLPGPPLMVYWRILCTANDNFVAGQMVDARGLLSGSGSTPAFTSYTQGSTLIANVNTSSGVQVFDASGTRRTLTLGNWRLVGTAIYAP